MWSTLALLLLFGAGIGIGAVPTCTVYELPSAADGSCEITINYMARDDKQALATCLEYFPTTFVKGEKTNEGKTKCIVTAAYQCVEPDTFLIFDKCYKFPKDPAGEYVTGTIAEYQDQSKKNNFCGEGKLSVFYSHTHAKFVGMKAHRLNINKLWIGITKDGRTIERPNMMIHAKMWKLVEGDYWDGDELKKIPPKGPNDEEQKIPDEAMYYFMRTRTDYVMNRIQGHFERASVAVKATFACEFESVYTANQAWYCNKLPILGIDAVYDDIDTNVDNKKFPRCLYVSASTYTFKGDNKNVAVAEMKNIKGCLERPSALHSAGMDDGTGAPRLYKDGLKYGGKLRIAANMVPKEEMTKDREYQTHYERPKCSTDNKDHDYLVRKWNFLNHHGIAQKSYASQIPWDPAYPKNECSDFPGMSSSVGIVKGKTIDMPPEVRVPAVCSLMFFQECENSDKPLCGELECKNKETYQTKTGSAIKPSGFFICQCPGADFMALHPSKAPRGGPLPPFTEEIVNGVKKCTWTGGDDKCAYLHFANMPPGQASDTYHVKGQRLLFAEKNPEYPDPDQEDRLDRMIVRKGCTVEVMAHRPDWPQNYVLINAGYGEHKVATSHDGTLPTEWTWAAASWIKPCVCSS